MDYYLEIGKKRTFAIALDWPGWCRSGNDETAALQALLDYAPRYAQAIRSAHLAFQPPEDLLLYNLVERLQGNAITDFGAPVIVPSVDAEPVSPAELLRFQTLLRAIWGSFDAVAKAAEGKELRYGPRVAGGICTRSSSMYWALSRVICPDWVENWKKLPNRLALSMNLTVSTRLFSSHLKRLCVASCPALGRVAESAGDRASLSATQPGTSSTTCGRSKTGSSNHEAW